MAEKVGEQNALLAYQCCLKAISDIEKVFKKVRTNPDFQRVPSVFYASNKTGQQIIEKEYEIRKKHGLPVTLLSDKEIKKKFGFEAPCALMNEKSAQIDAYKASVTLLDYHMLKHKLKIYTHTQVTACKKKNSGFELSTDRGHKITCKHVVIAAGFEAGQFLPEIVMKLTSTYAIISEPVAPEYLWEGRSLIWETKDPYIYIRTTQNNRIIVGGEDEEFQDPVKRDDLLRDKISRLEKKFRKLFPSIPFKTDMAWCGTFSSTEDGLPYIGEWPGKTGMHFALGYGGNGITFSMNAAQMIRNTITGKEDERYKVFGFERMKI
jgi:glycine/D-amino acid oxidase-like deaminating enzyme